MSESTPQTLCQLEDDEVWLPIPGYEGRYEVSSHARVRSLDRITIRSDGRTQRNKGRVLRQTLSSAGGYPVVAMSSNGYAGPRYVHHLVALAFHGPRPAGLEVRHLNGIAADCLPGNLAWGTHAENQQDQLRHGTNARAAKTHCIYGHLLTPPNLCPSWLPNRMCLACSRSRASRHQALRRGQTPPSHQVLSDAKYAALMAAA